MKAREVLQDCRECYWELKDSLEKKDLQYIRIKWITCLTFLRMVGHVLEKIDKPNYPNQSQIFFNLFKEKKNDEIFKNFIEKERNIALKEFEIKVVSDKIDVQTEVGMLFQDGNRHLVQSGEYLVYEETKKVIQFSSKKDTNGSENRLDWWIDNAIIWWDTYLKELEEKLNTT